MILFAVIDESVMGWGGLALTLGISIIAIAKSHWESTNRRLDKIAEAEQARFDRTATAEMNNDIQALKDDHKKCKDDSVVIHQKLDACEQKHRDTEERQRVADDERHKLAARVDKIAAGKRPGDSGTNLKESS